MNPSIPVGLFFLGICIIPMPSSFRGPALVIGMILIGFFGWKASLRRRQLIRATPTAKIATAAKGYAELNGSARNALTTPLRDPITDEPCVWFDVETEKFDFGKFRWKTVGHAQSKRPFAIEDDTGLCLVTPAEAHFVRPRGRRIRAGFGLRHTLARIADGQPLYAIGHLERIDDDPTPEVKTPVDPTRTPDFEGRVSALMREWKNDPVRRTRIFDPNGDGKTDAAEMENARRAARAEIERRLPRAEEQFVNATPPRIAAPAPAPKQEYVVAGRPVTHWLRKPDDDRPYIVSAVLENELIAKERRAGFQYLSLFILFAAGSLLYLADKFGFLRQ
jgi:hypothetical protein